MFCLLRSRWAEYCVGGCMTARGWGEEGRKAQLTVKGTSLPACPPTQTSSESSQLLGFREKKNLFPLHRLVGIYRFFRSFSTFRFLLSPQPQKRPPTQPGFVFNNVSAEEIERDSQTQSKRIKEQEESKHEKGAFRIGCGRVRLFFHLFMNFVQIFILRLHPLLIIFNNCVLCFIVWII